MFLPQEEMYIFMEYCDEGTLEEVSRLGLQEHVIRLYSKQITIAINVLHEHGIVHRDIKGSPHTQLAAMDTRLCALHIVGAAKTLDPSPTNHFSRKKCLYCEYATIKNPVLRDHIAHPHPWADKTALSFCVTLFLVRSVSPRMKLAIFIGWFSQPCIFTRHSQSTHLFLCSRLLRISMWTSCICKVTVNLKCQCKLCFGRQDLFTPTSSSVQFC